VNKAGSAELRPMCDSLGEGFHFGCPVEVLTRFGWVAGEVVDSHPASGSAPSTRVTVEFQAQGYACRKRAGPERLRRIDELEVELEEADPELFFDDCLKLVRGEADPPEPPKPKLIQTTCVRCGGNSNATKEEGATHYKCPKCGRRCEKCKGLYIVGSKHSCNFVKAGAELLQGHFGEYLKARARVGKELKDPNEEFITVCPTCLQGIMKEDDDQCDHMTCFNCGHEFCFACHADRTAIKAHGNHYHQPTCRYHFLYFGRDSYKPDECRQCQQMGHLCVRPLGQAVWDEYGRLIADGKTDERRIYKEYGHDVQW